MKIVGLTGGIGSGKSTILQYIASLGYPVYIADDAGKKMMKSPEIIQQIVDALGDNVLTEGVLDTKKIGKIVFQSAEDLAALNAIIHPAVQKDFEAFVKDHLSYPLIVKESAILFESGADQACDFTIVITAPEALRIARVMERDNVSKEDVQRRIKNQWSDDEKAKKADFVVENVHLEEAFKQISEILSKI